MKYKEVPYEILDKILRYEHRTGRFFWKWRVPGERISKRYADTFNSQFAYREAFLTVTNNFYKVSRIFDTNFFAHRVAWCLHTGSWPKQEIDHINGDRSDNRIENLREVDRATNSRNMARKRNSRNAVQGVGFHKETNKWRAYIKVNRLAIHLGLFDDYDEAVKSRLSAETKYGFHENNGRVGPYFN